MNLANEQEHGIAQDFAQDVFRAFPTDSGKTEWSKTNTLSFLPSLRPVLSFFLNT
jgi:hypothetical protein